MAVSIEELESFHSFAASKLNNRGSELEWRELFELWQVEKPSDSERREVSAIIRQGDQDIAAGRGQAVDDFNDGLEQKFKLSAE